MRIFEGSENPVPLRKRVSQTIEVTGAWVAFMAVLAAQPNGLATNTTFDIVLEAVGAGLAVLLVLRRLLEGDFDLFESSEERAVYDRRAWVVWALVLFAATFATRLAIGVEADSVVPVTTGLWAGGVWIILAGRVSIDPTR